MKQISFIKKLTLALAMVFSFASCEKERELEENTNANIYGKWQVYEVIDEDDVQIYKNTTPEEQDEACSGLTSKYIWSVEELLLTIYEGNIFFLYERTKSSRQLVINDPVTSTCKLDTWEVQNHTIDNKGSVTFNNANELRLIIGSEYANLDLLSISENEFEVYVKESIQNDQIFALGELGIIGYKMKFRRKP